MKRTILAALETFARKRPGFDPANYGFDPAGRSALRADARSATKDLKEARELLNAVEWRSITAEDLIEAAKHSFGGRLSIEPQPDGAIRLDYCAGQYWPMEYRKAVCAVLASALWKYWAQDFPADGAELIRKCASKELSRSVARRWFN